MNWLRDNRLSALIVGATLAVPAILVVYILGSLLVLRHDYQVQLERLEPRIARLKGLLESEPVLQASVGEVASKMEDAVYPAAAARPTVSAAFQKSVRGLLIAEGLSVSNIQALPIIEGENFDRVGLRLTVRGVLPQLDAAMAELSAHSPKLFVESMDLQPMSSTRRGRKAKDQDINATLRLVSLRAVQ